MSHRLLPIAADTYQRHPLHGSERIWTETNCYVDVWIELLHSFGVDPLASAAFPISSDFDGDQWTFIKFPPEDLRAAYGIEVAEMNIWRPVLDHVLEQLELGRLLTVEVDAWHLPDTHGVSYELAHVKSTIVANEVDVAARRLGYFHNAGYFELEGDDFDAIFHLGAFADSAALPPYVEMIKLDRLRHEDPASLAATADGLLDQHLTRAPRTNPMPAMAQRIAANLDWLRDNDSEVFHLYAFGVCRQCGAAAELAADFASWLAELGRPDPAALTKAAEHWRVLAETTKSLQFSLARLARGRSGDVNAVLDLMAAEWGAAMSTLAGRRAP